MKHLILVTGLVASISLPALAQPGDPIQLRNPNRRDGPGGAPDRPMGGGGFGGGYAGSMAGGNFGGNMPFTPTAPVAPPPVAMFADGAYLFVLRGDTLFQFDKKTLKLLNSAELPRPVDPAPKPATTGDNVRTQSAPPLRPGPGLNNGPTGF